MTAPLSGRIIVVTRPAHQARGLIADLEALGATVLAMPLIDIAAPSDFGPMDDALRDLATYDWVVFTSANAVRMVAERTQKIGISSFDGPRIAAVGSATAATLAGSIRAPDVVPDVFIADALPEAMGEVRGLKILVPQADIARDVLPNALRMAGAEVHEVVAYRILQSQAYTVLPDAVPDYILFTSSEAVRSGLGTLSFTAKSNWLKESNLACIGPITATTATELGLNVACVANPSTSAGLIAAVLNHATREEANA